MIHNYDKTGSIVGMLGIDFPASFTTHERCTLWRNIIFKTPKCSVFFMFFWWFLQFCSHLAVGYPLQPTVCSTEKTKRQKKYRWIKKNWIKFGHTTPPGRRERAIWNLVDFRPNSLFFKEFFPEIKVFSSHMIRTSEMTQMSEFQSEVGP